MRTKHIQVVRVHRQALEMGRALRAHLEASPRDSILFLIDWERALRDIGYELSKGMREHLARQRPLPAPQPGATELYDYVLRGGDLPFRFQGNIRISGLQEKNGPIRSSSSINPSIGRVPISSAASSSTSPQSATAAAMIPNTAGYSVIIQLTEDAINGALAVAYNFNLFPHRFGGSFHLPWADYHVDSDVSFEFNLGRPSISFSVTDGLPDMVKLSVSLTGKVALDMTILQYFSPTHTEYSGHVEVAFQAECELIVAARILDVNTEESAVFLDWRDIQTIALHFTSIDVPADLEEYLRRLIQRILRTQLHNHPLTPLSFKFNRSQRAGIRLTSVASRIIPAQSGRSGALTIALETISGSGRIDLVTNIIPPGEDFAVVSTRYFLIEQAWKLVARPKLLQYQHPDVAFGDAQMDLLSSGRIWLWVKGEEHKTCFEVDFTADTEVVFELFPEGRTCYDPATGQQHPCDINRTRLKPVRGPEVHISTVARILLSIIGGLILGPVGAIIVNIIIEILEDRIGSAAGDMAESFSIGFYQEIPNTPITIAASCNQAVIQQDGIYATGNVKFLI